MTGADLASWVESHPLRFDTEAELQDQLEARLREKVEARREVDLGEAGRIDFLVGRVGLEVKTKGSLSDVIRQLRRYAEHRDVEELVLVTTKLQHARVPRHLAGKPVHVAALFRGFV